jgi:UDP-N-acetylglucosamine transferase subunit ALG13
VIFVTVGTQLPFERLVRAVDQWAASQPARPDVLAQVGSGRNDYPNLRCVPTLDGQQYAEAISKARLIVAHAGTGSILNALDRGVPTILLPRDHRHGEHRDDHQFQTARQLEKMQLVTVAWSESEIPVLIQRELDRPATAATIRGERGTELIEYLRSYIRSVLDRTD